MRALARLTAAFAVLIAATTVSALAQDRQSIDVGGVERTYIVTVPPAVAASPERVPLVIVLHGGGGNAVNAIEMSGFDEKAMEEGFIAAFPDGSGRTILKTWNAVHCCAYAMNEGVDDIGFIAALIDELVARYPVDPARVYVTGMSNGGMMTHQLAIALPDRIAAIAPIVGTLFGAEVPPPLPVPALIFNGEVDSVVPPAGGSLGIASLLLGSWDGTPLLPAEAQAAFWAATNGCTPVPAVEDTTAARIERYDCPPGADVEFVLVKGMGHAWPGGREGRAGADLPGTVVDATAMMWEFFQQFSRPQAAANG